MTHPENSQLVLEEIRKLMGELHPELRRQPTVTLDSVLDRELGLDSLARVELLARLEQRCSVTLPEKVLTSAETPRDIIRALAAGHLSRPSDFAPEETVAQQSVVELDQAVHQATTLTEVLALHARKQPEQAHIFIETFKDEAEAITFGALYELARHTAGGLQQTALEPGDRVAIMLPTGKEYFAAFSAILLAGCVPVPLYPPTRPSQIEEHLRRHQRILKNARARVLITIPEVRLIGRLLQSQLPALAKVVTVTELQDQGRGEQLEPVPRHGQDTAFLQYTSGSTGDPKGVILSHANLLANIRAMGEVTQVRGDDTFVSWLPLYHDMGLIGAWLGSLYFGCRLVVMSPLSFISRPERWLWAIHKYRGTLSASPNFGYELCCRRINEEAIQGLDLSSWRLAFNGAEAISHHTVDQFITKFGPYGFARESYAPVYGLAESSVGLAFPPVGRPPLVDRIQRELFVRTGRAVPSPPGAVEEAEEALSFVACGRPLPGHQVRVVDTAGRELPERSQGRLEFKGPSATSGYLHAPEQTRRLFHDDWLDTGDLAYIAGGDVYLTGRVKDIIIRGGRNIYPHEYEEAIGEITGIRKGCVAVFGSQHGQDGTERVVVLAESRKQGHEAHQQLTQKINQIGVDLLGLPPDEVVIVPPGAVLKTSSGKIRRSSTRQFYEQGLIGRKKRAVWLQLSRLALLGLVPLTRRTGRLVGGYCFAAYCWLMAAALMLPALALLTLPLPRRLSWSVAHHCLRTLARLTGTRLTISGEEHLCQNTPALLVANHMSYLDALVLAAAMPAPCAFVAKAELAGNPILRRALEQLDTLFVERFDAEQGREDLDRIIQLAGSGRRVIFFAEGTLQRMPGLLPFQMGAFVAAAEKGLAIIPVALTGTRNKLRAGSWFPRPGHAQVRFSQAIAPEGRDWQAALKLRHAVRQEILRLVGEPDLAEEFSSLSQLDIAGSEDRHTP
ncbi:AMP-binding protein [Desulfogranum mediterraneum]|uniref:AMP-binding protein n=1 Tax=Desulfogranum mediterraneum TaxID=160661 RepID=UPI0003FB4A6C|nr:AMP-binding protein [Desulfogranum mediterraneum]